MSSKDRQLPGSTSTENRYAGKLPAETSLAATTIRGLLEGASPNGIDPCRCGEWEEVVKQLYEAHRLGGTSKVKTVFDALAAATPSLAQLVCEEPETGFFLSETADDEGNAQCVSQLHGAKFAYCEAYGWFHYNGRCWQRQDAEAALDRAIVATLQLRREAAVRARHEHLINAAKPSATHVRNCKFLFRSLVAVPVEEFDSSPDHINCNNGVLNLRTGELLPHGPHQRYTYYLPVDYDPATEWKEWAEFLQETVAGGREMVEYLQETVGYTLTGHTSEECLFYIVGPTRSGKGTFCEALLELLGRKPLAVQTDFTTFTRKRENDTNNADLATLKPCRFVVASESGRSQWLNAAKVKQITGGDDVFCALKYRNHFSYRPQYTIWLVSNHLPRVDVDDDAAWYRLRVIEFPNSHAGREDKLLKERMKSPEMQRQILAWAVAGAMRWYERAGHGLPLPRKVEQATKNARDSIDYVGQWLDECVIKLDEDAYVPNEKLYGCYEEWCENRGVTPKKQTSLTQALKAKGYRAGESKKVDGKPCRGCFGIGLLQ